MILAAGIVAALILAGWIAAPGLSRLAHDRVIQVLQQHFGADLEVQNLRVSVFPSVRIDGEGLVLRQQGRPGAPPLIAIQKFTAATTIAATLLNPPHVHQLRLDGLTIQVSRRGDRPAEGKKAPRARVPDFIIENVSADGTTLIIIPKDEKKQPLRFDLRKLQLWSAGTATPMSFRATLTNAKPPGDIETTGQFGPWNRDDPDQTPVGGHYIFRDADLGVFRGISGKLASDGRYMGVLERIEVDGSTDVPEFAIRVSGNPVHLRTQFHATVDGTDGDTLLQPVLAQFGNSKVTARGGVEGQKGVPGKTVTLDVVAEGRVEDMLRLGAKGKPPAMNGAIRFRTKLVIPPGDVDIAQKLRLNGTFNISSARFTNLDIQHKINSLSHKGKGEPKVTDDGSAASDFAGRFILGGGLMRFPRFSFSVPGVALSLDGEYGLVDGSLDFHGIAELQAKLSQTTTGWKSIVLKAVDPFFKGKKGGARLPIKITGTRDQPDFGLDLHSRHRPVQ